MLFVDVVGVVLELVGDVIMIYVVNDIVFVCGGDWKEVGVGMNGIGIVFVLCVLVIVYVGEYYCVGIKSWSCLGVFIFDLFDGSVVGIVGILVCSCEFSVQIFVLVVMVVSSVEYQML